VHDREKATKGGGETMTPLRIADLFCGAGETSTGAVQAARNHRRTCE
jgi:hypothetical protein